MTGGSLENQKGIHERLTQVATMFSFLYGAKKGKEVVDSDSEEVIDESHWWLCASPYADCRKQKGSKKN